MPQNPDHQYDVHVSQMKIGHFYTSHDPKVQAIAIVTDIEHLRNKDPKHPYLDMDIASEFIAHVAKRLNIPGAATKYGHDGVGWGLSNGELRIAPEMNVSKKQLEAAVEAEIKEAKAHLAGKHAMASVAVDGGHETDLTGLQATGKIPKKNQLG